MYVCYVERFNIRIQACATMFYCWYIQWQYEAKIQTLYGIIGMLSFCNIDKPFSDLVSKEKIGCSVRLGTAGFCS